MMADAQIKAVDHCENCGDIVVLVAAQHLYWTHYRGPDSTLNRCQHTVPYGLDATAAHDGRYFQVSGEASHSA